MQILRNALDLKFKGETLEREYVVWGLADLAVIYKGDDGIIYVQPRHDDTTKPPISLSSFDLIDEERDILIAALDAVLLWLGKAIADDCFHNCSRPSAAEAAFDNADAVLKRLRC